MGEGAAEGGDPSHLRYSRDASFSARLLRQSLPDPCPLCIPAWICPGDSDVTLQNAEFTARSLHKFAMGEGEEKFLCDFRFVAMTSGCMVKMDIKCYMLVTAYMPEESP